MDLHDYIDVAENYDLYVKEVEKASDTFSEEAIINFHLELAEKYGSTGVLDIGCGTGVTLLPLIRKGFSTTAIDISGPMIEIVNKKLAALDKDIAQNATTICAGMEDFHIDRKYSLAFIARTGFMHLLDHEQQRKALLNIKEHLAEKGILSLNTFYPNHEMIAEQINSGMDNYFLRFTYQNARGNTEKIYNSTTYNPETQVSTGKWLFEEFGDNNEIISKRERPISMRYTFKKEMEYLFELCGFEILEVYGDYLKGEAKYPGWLIWVARKK